MGKIYYFIIGLLFAAGMCTPAMAQAGSPDAGETVNTVKIYGHVTDYEGNPLPNVSVGWGTPHFKEVIDVFTDDEGYYEVRVPVGHYFSMGAINMDHYPVFNRDMDPEQARLEFWGWNFIADRDMEFDLQYHRMEVYGLNVFRIQGGTPVYTIYCRPMSLTRSQGYDPAVTPHANLAPSPENLAVEVTIDGEQVEVLAKEELREYWGEGLSSNAYIFTVALPKNDPGKPYSIFRVRLTDLENGDKGEATYFYEFKDYVWDEPGLL